MEIKKNGSKMRCLGKIIISGLAVLYAAPVIMTIAGSFVTEEGIDFSGYGNLLLDCFPFYPMFWNSVLYAAAGTFLQLIVVILCAFGMTQARVHRKLFSGKRVHRKFPAEKNSSGKRLLFLLYVVFMMMPLQVTLLPNYVGLRDMGLLGSRWAILLPSIFSPFGVVVMYQYLKQIDQEIIEAMRLECSSVWRIIWYAVLPQIRTCVFAAAVFIFADSWNMLEQPLLFLKDSSKQPLSVLIANASQYSGDVLYPAAVFFILPVLLMYLFFQDSLEKGLTLKI